MNTLCIRYPSGSKQQNFNNCVISPKFCQIINSIIYENKFDEADYDELSVDEQKKFDDLLTLCRVDGKTAMSLVRHKKYNDDELKKSIDRFNILKGEIVAGNDNPDISKN